MPYEGQPGFYTVFPTGAGKGSSSSSSSSRKRSGGATKRPPKAKPPCKYGPRLANGRCPTKPRSPRAQSAGIARGIYSAATGAKRGSAGDRIAGALGGALGTHVLRRARSEAARRAGTALAARIAALGATGTLALSTGILSTAGLLSYSITRAILDRRARTRQERADKAFELARAYRAARVEAQRLNGGKPLTIYQLQPLADDFKALLEGLGLETTNLKGL